MNPNIKFQTTYILKLFFLILIIASCRETHENTVTHNGLQGEWALVKYTPSAWTPDDTFEYIEGQIVWAFDTIPQMVTIEIDPTTEFTLIENGIHEYEFGDNGCNHEENKFIIINEYGFGTLIIDDIENGHLVITEQCVDGPTFNFVRNP